MSAVWELLDRIAAHADPRVYADLVGRLVILAPQAVAEALDHYEAADIGSPQPVSVPTDPSPLPGSVGNLADVPASVEPERGEVAVNDGAATPRSAGCVTRVLAGLPPIRWADC
jgi:hypothetical protein